MKRPVVSHISLVGGWLNDLSIMTAGQRSIEEQRAKVAALTGVLADAFPDDATFTKESLYAIARQTTFLPAFGELHRMLNAWWESRRPRSFVPPIELDSASLSGAARAHAISWLKDAALGERTERELALSLDVTRSHAQAAYDWLIKHDAHAEGIARAKGWIYAAPSSDDFTDPGRIIASVRNIVDPPHPQANAWLSALRAAVQRAAPHLVDLVPMSISEVEGSHDDGKPRQPTPAQRVDILADDGIVRVERADPPPTESTTRKPPGQLSPEALHQIRMANPLLRAIAERQAKIDAERRLHDADSDFAPPPRPDDLQDEPEAAQEPVGPPGVVITPSPRKAPLWWGEDDAGGGVVA